MPTSDSKTPVNSELTFNNAPNMLTLLRILMVPFVVALMFMRTPTADFGAMVIFVIASITDYFDGYLARVRNQVTIYGKLMDPLADKVLVVSALVMLQELDRIHPVVVILLICREMAITGLRALASAEGVILAASRSAKWKTATQMVAIPFLMVAPGLWGLPTKEIGLVLLYISLAISLWSAKDYIVEFFQGMQEASRQKQQVRRLARAARKATRHTRLRDRLKKLRKNT